MVDPSVAAAVEQAHRVEWAFVLAATVRVTADLDVAEECAQGAFAKALVAWEATGIPRNPGAWLTTAARNLAMDHHRREAALQRKLPLLVEPDASVTFVYGRGEVIEDDRLRLIFTCCHPALSSEAQVALTLRFVCGLSNDDVARAFLVKDATMAARVTRAKQKIAKARIPYRAPRHDELPSRIEPVLQVVYLVFTTGHTAPSGESLLREDLVKGATTLARMLRELLPTDPGVTGLLGLILLTDARRTSRTSRGEPVLLEDQDRSTWDRAMIAEGQALVHEALEAAHPSVYALLGGIAEAHDVAPSWEATEWERIVALYDRLDRDFPSPVVTLNRAVAIGFANGPAAGLRELEPLAGDPHLARYPYLAIARAVFSQRLGDVDAARLFYEAARTLTDSPVERELINRRLDELSAVPGATQPCSRQ
jgi:RNA polymerase sigma factor (sigma-70 family)